MDAKQRTWPNSIDYRKFRAYLCGAVLLCHLHIFTRKQAQWSPEWTTKKEYTKLDWKKCAWNCSNWNVWKCQQVNMTKKKMRTHESDRGREKSFMRNGRLKTSAIASTLKPKCERSHQRSTERTHNDVCNIWFFFCTFVTRQRPNLTKGQPVYIMCVCVTHIITMCLREMLMQFGFGGHQIHMRNYK